MHYGRLKEILVKYHIDMNNINWNLKFQSTPAHCRIQLNQYNKCDFKFLMIEYIGRRHLYLNLIFYFITENKINEQKHLRS